MVKAQPAKIKPYRYYEQGYLSLPNSHNGGVRFPVLVLKAASPDGPDIASEAMSGKVITEQEVISMLENDGLSFCIREAATIADDLNLIRVTIHGKEAAKQVEYLTLAFDRVVKSLDVLDTDLPKLLSNTYASRRPELTATFTRLLEVSREARSHIPRQKKRERNEPWNHDAIYLACILNSAAERAGGQPGLGAATGAGVKFITAALARAGAPIPKDAGAIVSAWRRFKENKVTF